MEINTGIIVSCMPTMPALIQDIRSQVSGARQSLPKPQLKPHPQTYQPQPQSRSQASQPTTITTTTNHHKASSTSRSGKSCLKKHSSHDTPQRPPQVRFLVGERRDDGDGDGEGEVPFELDSTPVVRRMEEARRVRREPLRSYFSDDSDAEDWRWLS